jgi:hypothetical protein
MADTKISALPAATTPLAGTEVLPIVQGGVTEKVAVDDLTVKNVRSNATSGILQVTGPAAAATRVMTTPDANFTAARTDAAQSFTGDQTLSTGNLVIGTSGKGIDFSATPGTGTSELLDDYEEGTWTPTVDAGWTGVTYAEQSGNYTKVGNMVTAWFRIQFSGTSAAANIELRGLPFNLPSTASNGGGSLRYCSAPTNETTGFLLYPVPSSGSMFLYQDNDTAARIASNGNASGSFIMGCAIYFV